MGILPGMRRGAWAFWGPLVLLSGCTGDGGATALPPGPAAGPTTASASAAARTPDPVDDEQALPDSDAARTASPAQGSVRLTVRGPVPGGGAGTAYVAWVRASLTAYARPGTDDGGVARYAAAPVVADVREGVRQLVLRGWAEYGTATLSGVTVSVTGSAAAVSACLDLSGMATRDAAGRLAGRDRPVRSAARLARDGARWVVTADRRTPLARCS
ncbi:MAG: hypothetical protein AVDCRST_MAG41-2266 [uncultured Corynebacteriales bacterium]|uniref:Uncharacterized protein n=1 Tax=uncultured Mycobacteriales bacterium TaxID=581187 RepID=A0A6J4INS0_9ACTN|nr:MAG: hypothetical protein AVDCRST_MAG41-2266 [uncultured Corynebacteriales bacterium]